MKTIIIALLVVVFPWTAHAGLLWGPNTRTVIHNYGVPATAAYVELDAAVYVDVPQIIQTPTGYMTVYADGSTAHSGGRLQRRVARQERWRARHGIK